jgi:hypothetical protein
VVDRMGPKDLGYPLELVDVSGRLHLSYGLRVLDVRIDFEAE